MPGEHCFKPVSYNLSPTFPPPRLLTKKETLDNSGLSLYVAINFRQFLRFSAAKHLRHRDGLAEDQELRGGGPEAVLTHGH